MARRTLRIRKNGNSATVVRASDDDSTVDGDSITTDEPNPGESVNNVDGESLDNYIVDEPINGNGDTFVDPATGSGSATETGAGRKRRSDSGTGRKRGRPRATATEATNSVANLLFTIHIGMAHFLGSEVFAITDDEAKELGKAITNVSQLYELPPISEKMLAWVNLAMVGGKIYGPRFVAAKLNKKKSKPNVITFETPLKQAEPVQG